MEKDSRYSLERVLTEKQIDHVIRRATRDTSYELICSEVNPASEGISGYLGDHMKAVVHVKVKDGIQKVHLFMKTMPMDNKPKANMIKENHFFKREMLVFQILDEIDGDQGPNPWYTKAYLCTESVLVMPDLSVQGYREHPLLQTLDLQHVLVTVASIARYHAAMANYQTKETRNLSPCNIYRAHRHILNEPAFNDNPWIKTAAKLSADLLDAFSNKYTKAVIPGLELKLARSFVEACDSFIIAEDSLNVLTHRDLWNNNILFKYENGAPINAILIDYQCVRYGPPAFDITSFLHLTTSTRFREENEKKVLKHYFRVFSESLKDVTRRALDVLGYDEKEFLCWCERSRMFGNLEAVALSPQVLMDPRTGEEVFGNPDTFLSMAEVDRSGPVLDYCTSHELFKERQMEIVEEYVERYILPNLEA